MTIKPFVKVLAALVASAMMFNASANSISLDSASYDGASGQITVTISYDFTDFAMFGGGANLMYDASALSFVSYTQDVSMSGADEAASPTGSLVSDGNYEGFGIGTFAFQTGITDAASFGTFVFDVLAGCDDCIMLGPNAANPMVSLAGMPVNAEIFGNGITVASVSAIPVPAAVWFMLSGLGALLGFGRKSA